MAGIVDDPEQLSIDVDHESTEVDSQDTFAYLMAARVRQRATEKGVSKSALADAAGIKRSSMTSYWPGNRPYPLDALPGMASKLSTSVNWMLTGADDEDEDLVELQEIDLAYGLGATFAGDVVEVKTRRFARAWVEDITRTPAAMLTFSRGRGDSMMPTIADGDMILIDRSQRAVREQDALWALTVGDFAMIKRVRGRGERITLLSDNERVPPDEYHHEEINVVGRVIFIGRRV